MPLEWNHVNSWRWNSLLVSSSDDSICWTSFIWGTSVCHFLPSPCSIFGPSLKICCWCQGSLGSRGESGSAVAGVEKIAKPIRNCSLLSNAVTLWLENWRWTVMLPPSPSVCATLQDYPIHHLHLVNLAGLCRPWTWSTRGCSSELRHWLDSHFIFYFPSKRHLKSARPENENHPQRRMQTHDYCSSGRHSLSVAPFCSAWVIIWEQVTLDTFAIPWGKGTSILPWKKKSFTSTKSRRSCEKYRHHILLFHPHKQYSVS